MPEQPQRIVKAPGRVAPNMRDYRATSGDFSWDMARKWLARTPAGGLNIAHEAVDRHTLGAHGARIAMRWLGKHGEVREYSYQQLRAQSARFANGLASLGVGAGDTVAALTGRLPELYIAALGALRHRAVFCPLFSAFGPEPLHARLSRGRVLVTTAVPFIVRSPGSPRLPNAPRPPCSIRERGIMKRAYVTMVSRGDTYLPGAQALGRSLDETGSSLPRVVMVTPDVPDAVASQLAACGWDPCPVAPIANPHPDGELLFPRFGLSFSKLRAFDLTEFERVVFLDADTLVLRNVDHLFDRPSPTAAPDFFMPDHFNSGVMVLEPSRPLFIEMQGALARAPSYDGGDQGFLNWFWPDWWALPEAHRLRSGYNLHHFIFQFLLAHPHLRQQCLDRVHIVHYTLQKPWLGRFMLTGGAQIWWDKFYAAHPEQDSAWRRRLHQLQDWSFSSLVSLLSG